MGIKCLDVFHPLFDMIRGYVKYRHEAGIGPNLKES
jgi:hypothetical protein